MALFTDRADAGRQLAAHLDHYRDRDDVLVLGLPRGGVPVAHEVARALQARLDVFVVRKLGAPRPRGACHGSHRVGWRTRAQPSRRKGLWRL